MATHAELVNELPLLERMSTSERLRLARKRRSQQLRKYAQLEKQREKRELELLNSQEQSGTTEHGAGHRPNTEHRSKKSSSKVSFAPNVVLLEAGCRNDVKEVRRMLENGISPNSSNADGLTALHQCCIDDCEELLELLLQFGANCNIADNEMWTPLHAAAACGRTKLCRHLVDHGADLLAVNADGNMPYDICQDQETLDFIESEMTRTGVTQQIINEVRSRREKAFLRDLEYESANGEDLGSQGSNGETPLHIAAANGYLLAAEFLLDHGLNVDAVDNDLWQPIHCAACWNQLSMLELLVEHGSSLEAKTRNGETPLDICEDMEIKQRIFQLLKDKKSKTSQKQTFVVPHKSGRRPSITNTRSASVRRTSMKQKKSLAQKEAKEEAMRLKHQSARKTKDDDDDTNETKLTANFKKFWKKSSEETNLIEHQKILLKDNPEFSDLNDISSDNRLLTASPRNKFASSSSPTSTGLTSIFKDPAVENSSNGPEQDGVSSRQGTLNKRLLRNRNAASCKSEATGEWTRPPSSSKGSPLHHSIHGRKNHKRQCCLIF